jgi:hypothetical protein
MAQNRYSAILERIFSRRFRPRMSEVAFARDDITAAARDTGTRLPKNIGDLLYSFRFRAPLPESIASTAPPGRSWLIELVGRGTYRFRLRPTQATEITPNGMIAVTKVPDATPGVVAMYAQGDEQALLARLRYNRLLDVFLGIACYSLQNHLRTAVRGVGQVETDELYVGIDRKGVHYVIPVQAKAHGEKLRVVQVEQDVALCAERFPSLVCRAVGAQFLEDKSIALFEFETTDAGVRIASEKHYLLVPPDAVSAQDLAAYRSALSV